MRRYFALGVKHKKVTKATRCLAEKRVDKRDSETGLTKPERRKALELIQKTGIVLRWFNGEGGYGFIDPDDGGEAVFVHHTGIAAHAEAQSLRAGVRVSYEVVRRKMAGMWAKDVCAAE